jgi:hypothetical protein
MDQVNPSTWILYRLVGKLVKINTHRCVINLEKVCNADHDLRMEAWPSNPSEFTRTKSDCLRAAVISI